MPDTTIEAGQLNRRCSVLRIKSTATIKSDGKVDESLDANWELIRANRKCRIIPSVSREFLVGNQVNAQITHQIEMRFDSESQNYTTKDKVKVGTRVFNIAGPLMNVNEDDVLLRFPAIEVK